MNRPLNRYDRLGWLCQKPSRPFQQIGPAQERAVLRPGGAHDDVIAAARADMAAIQHEFLRGETRLARDFIELFGAGQHLVPILGGVDVDLDHAGIRRHGELVEGARRAGGG